MESPFVNLPEALSPGMENLLLLKYFNGIILAAIYNTIIMFLKAGLYKGYIE